MSEPRSKFRLEMESHKGTEGPRNLDEQDLMTVRTGRVRKRTQAKKSKRDALASSDQARPDVGAMKEEKEENVGIVKKDVNKTENHQVKVDEDVVGEEEGMVKVEDVDGVYEAIRVWMEGNDAEEEGHGEEGEEPEWETLTPQLVEGFLKRFYGGRGGWRRITSQE
jgi:hypothetical protein